MSGEIPTLNYGGSAGSYRQDNNRPMSENYPSYQFNRNPQIGSAGERYPNPNQGSGIGSAGNAGYGRGPYEHEIGTGVRPEYSSGQGGLGSNTRMPDNPAYSNRPGGIGWIWLEHTTRLQSLVELPEQRI
ncbi:unnamed protein product [Cylicocyclus nassatus]|uniref:Uncharacterized protein n=1 Tax=Cylicocyclus nassatus TaxID=53992 RepID=A0AA36GUW2_CYLNA|nr:unnamed protein product [Cylicocyclus nassatus]